MKGDIAFAGVIEPQVVVGEVVVSRHLDRALEQGLAISPELDLPHGNYRARAQPHRSSHCQRHRSPGLCQSLSYQVADAPHEHDE